MSCWPWAATRPRTIRSASASSWRRKRNRNAKLVCVDPRFNRTAAVADRFVQIRAGTDIAFLGGLINYALVAQPVSRGVRPAVHQRALPRERDSTPSTRRAASSRAGTRSGRPTPTRRAGATSSDADGFAKVDPTLQHPRSVFQVMKRVLRALHAGSRWRTSAAAAPTTSRRRPSSSPRPTRRIAPARCCTRSAGRITATRCS